MIVFDGKMTVEVTRNAVGEIPCPACGTGAVQSPLFEVEAYLCPKCRRVWKVIPTGVAKHEIEEYLRLCRAMRTNHQNRRTELIRQQAEWWAEELAWQALQDSASDPEFAVSAEGLLENFEEMLRNGEDPFDTSWALCAEIWKILEKKRDKK